MQDELRIMPLNWTCPNNTLIVPNYSKVAPISPIFVKLSFLIILQLAQHLFNFRFVLPFFHLVFYLLGKPLLLACFHVHVISTLQISSHSDKASNSELFSGFLLQFKLRNKKLIFPNCWKHQECIMKVIKALNPPHTDHHTTSSIQRSAMNLKQV